MSIFMLRNAMKTPRTRTVKAHFKTWLKNCMYGLRAARIFYYYWDIKAHVGNASSYHANVRTIRPRTSGSEYKPIC